MWVGGKSRGTMISLKVDLNLNFLAHFSTLTEAAADVFEGRRFQVVESRLQSELTGGNFGVQVPSLLPVV